MNFLLKLVNVQKEIQMLHCMFWQKVSGREPHDSYFHGDNVTTSLIIDLVSSRDGKIGQIPI